MPTDNDRLLDAVNRVPATIADVMSIMNAVDGALPDADGLKTFNRLYLTVTEAIEADFHHGRWRSPRWMERLDVEFAILYFDAIRAYTTGRNTAPRAWVEFFDRRLSSGIAKVQYGLAGIHAHINRDLACAVVRACERTGCAPRLGSPEHRDYLRVNEILDAVEVRAMQRLATGSIRRVVDAINPLDRIAVVAVLARARDLAWLSAMVMHRRGRSHVEAIDGVVGALSRALLVPTERFGTLDPEPPL